MDFWLDIWLADDVVVVVAIDYEHRPNVDALVKIDLSKMVLCVLDRQRWPERESLPIRTVTLSNRRTGLLIAEKITKIKSMNFQYFHQAACAYLNWLKNALLFETRIAQTRQETSNPIQNAYGCAGR